MQYTIFVILAPLAAVSVLTVTIYSLRYRRSPGAQFLYPLEFMILGWLIFNTAELLAPTPELTLLFAKITYIFIQLTPVTWLAFSMVSTGRGQHLLASVLPFYVLALVTILLIFTNQMHHLMWRNYFFRAVGDFLGMWVAEYGPWFWVSSIADYGVAVSGVALILWDALPSFKVYRKQSISVTLGMVLPLLVNFVYIFRIIPGLRKDFTPVAIAIAVAAYGMGMLRYQLFDLKPIARNQLIDNMNDAMLVLDQHRRLIDLNPAAAELLCASPDDVIGQPFEDAACDLPLSEALDSQQPVRTELCAVVSGMQRWYTLRASPLFNADERLAGHLLVLHEVTHWKAAEAERERLIADLNAYAHTVAHDLKSPLSVLVGYASLLSADDPEAQENVRTVVRTSRKMVDIVNALLLVASVRRLEDVYVTPLDMDVILKEACSRLAHEIETAGAVLEIDMTDWPVALGFDKWVEEVWVNYISNAVKYGGQPPHLTFDAELLPGGMVRFWLRDKGPGIPADAQVTIFDEFSGVGSTSPDGHGLGLSIVRRIVEKLGGEVGVESTPEQGSAFYFTLPATDASPPDDPSL